MHRALQEPAILFLIFLKVSTHDLLQIEGVCALWQAVINSSAVLLERLYLRPSSSGQYDDGQPEMNPLLNDLFHPFLGDGLSKWSDNFNAGYSNGGPWRYPSSLHYMYSEAKWRKMIPCSPAPNQLVVHVWHGGQDEVAWLNFSNNQQTRESLKPEISCLTFGLIWDMLECAWFQGSPWFLQMARIHYGEEFVAEDKRGRYPSIYDRLLEQMPQDLRLMLIPNPGRVVITLFSDRLSLEERKQKHDEAAATYEKMQKRLHRQRNWPSFKRRRHMLCGFISPPLDKTVYTNEFHFEDGLSFDEIPWDHRQTFNRPGFEEQRAPAPTPDPPPRRSWNPMALSWWKRN